MCARVCVGGCALCGNVKWRCVRCAPGSRTQRTGRKIGRATVCFCASRRTQGHARKQDPCAFAVRGFHESSRIQRHAHARRRAADRVLRRRCVFWGPRRTNAAVSGTSRTRTVRSTMLVSYHSLTGWKF